MDNNQVIDVAASYPNGEDILNIQAETNYRELSKIENCTEWQRRIIGINLTGGAVNAAEFCRLVYQLPNYETLSRAYAQEHNKSHLSIETNRVA